MFLEEAAGDESLAAVQALIRPLARMISQMQNKRGPLGEPSSALRATVRFLAGVYPPMNGQVLLTGELFLAEVAFGDLLVSVAPPVDHQPPVGREHGSAQVAEMRLLLIYAVPLLQVPLEEHLPREPLQAYRARVFPTLVLGRPRRQRIGVVESQMIREILLVRVGLLAVLAAVQLLPRVNVNVLQVFRPEEKPFLALLALERIVFGVSTAVALQIRFLVRPVVAQVAGEPLRAGVN